MPSAVLTVCKEWKDQISNRRSHWLHGLRRGESITGEWTGNRKRQTMEHASKVTIKVMNLGVEYIKTGLNLLVEFNVQT